MRLVRKSLEKDSSGSITMCPEEMEDMWHAYNLIQEGDLLKATAIRKVVSETATGSTDKTSVHVTLTIRVEAVTFDTQGGVLGVKGRNTEENKYVKMGQYHTLDLEMNRNFTLTKPAWDSISLQIVHEASDATKRADVAAVVCQEGMAQVCLVTQSMTIVRQRIDVQIPRKRRGMVDNHEKGLDRFYEQILQAVIRHVDFSIVKVLILASPGFVKDQLLKYILDKSIRAEHRSILDNKSKFLLVHCSSGHKQALAEVLNDSAVQARLADTKYAKETAVLARFFKTLDGDPNRAWYGYGHVALAAERAAVEVLLVTDKLFRSADIPTRRNYVALVEQVKATGGIVLVFSSLHVSGEQLDQLGGVAAILNYPMEDLDEGDEVENGDAANGHP